MHLRPELLYTKFNLPFIYYIPFLLDTAACYNSIMDFLVIYTQYIYLFNKTSILNYYKLTDAFYNSLLNIGPDKVLLVEYIYYNYYINQLNNIKQFGRIIQC